MANSKGGVVMSNYTNSGTYLRIKCCNMHETYISPSSVLKGKWCQICKCDGNIECYIHMTNFQLKYFREFAIMAFERKCELISTYINTNSTIRIKCKCGYTMNIRPKTIRTGKWCRVCERRSANRMMNAHPLNNIYFSRDKKDTRGDQVEEMFTLVMGDQVEEIDTNSSEGINDAKGSIITREYTNKEMFIVENINRRGGILLSPYSNEKSLVSIQCTNRHEFEMYPMNIRRGYWCKVCEKGK
ncbi:MAG: hypothetical protein JKY22_00355 [Flavobacteriaceae bacterium]|nr:hypothetical protein [Flavobacteriaceae bacterium]